MAPPPVSIYVTSLTSQPKVRQNIELLRRSLRALEIPYTEHDLVMDEEAKKRWQRAKPAGQVIGLPGYLVGGEWVGTMDDFEYAAETSTLPEFLHQNADLRADQSIGEAELEKLMREMSDADLDALAAHVDKSGEKKPSASAGETKKEASTASETKAAPPQVDVKKAMDSVLASSSSGGIQGSSSAADQTIASITAKAADIVKSLGGPEAHTGTLDSPTSADPTGKTPLSSGSKVMVDEPKESSPTGPGSTEASLLTSRTTDKETQRARRLSKEEIAEKMLSANSVEGLLASLDLAEGKEEKEKKD